MTDSSWTAVPQGAPAPPPAAGAGAGAGNRTALRVLAVLIVLAGLVCAVAPT